VVTGEILIERLGEADFNFLSGLPYEKISENLRRLRTISSPLCKCLYLYALAQRSRELTFPSGQSAKNHLIPKKIIQFWNNKVPPADVEATMSSWRGLPNYEYVQYNEQSAHQFMQENYCKDVVQLYEY
jgi:hypothetical protein